MEVEKRGVKGGFLQLFDWNGKSRKKLFSSKSEAPDSSNQGKENLHASLVARHQRVLIHEGNPQNPRNHSDCYYASSAGGDSEYGTKAPGVVARLMGLDSLPKSNVNEPLLNQFTEFHSFRSPNYLSGLGAEHGFQNEHDIVIFESARNKLDGLSGNPLDPRLQKLQRRPIERFQTEALPPKSAKPISATHHHRLLSPIKSPGFIPPKNAAFIVEAASKVIEQNPRSNARGKLLMLGSSLTSLKVRDLTEKMESAHRSLLLSSDAYQKGKEQNHVKRVKKPVITRGQGQVEVVDHLYKGSEESKRSVSQRLKSKERPVQKRDGLSSGTKRSSEKPRVRNEATPVHSGKNLQTTEKKAETQLLSKKPSQVLRLNHQKQNCISALDVENYGPCSQPRDRKDSTVTTNYINGRNNKTVNKIVAGNMVKSKRTNFVSTDPAKDFTSSREKTTSKKKLLSGSDFLTDKSFAQDSVVKNELSVKRNVAFESNPKWDGVGQNSSSLGVVSFTFTSPIKNSGVKSRSNSNNLEIYSSCITNRDRSMHESGFNNSAESSSGFNVVGGDALTVLLEQKLKELSSMVEFSPKESSEVASFSGSFETNGSLGSVVESSDNKLFLESKIMDKIEYTENNGDRMDLHMPGSASLSSRPSVSGASSDSFDDEGKSQPTENDVEISDTVSSLSALTTSVSYVIDSRDSSFWELHYIRDILCSSKLMFEDFALRRAQKVIDPELFDQLENQKPESNKNTEERFLFERKVLFDCVSECLETRCEQLICGSCRFWAKQTRMFERKQWLSEEVYREISSWTNEEELNVDELVEKDMSSKNGKWIEFDIEAFEEGLEIEMMILKDLVDELIDDFLF